MVAPSRPSETAQGKLWLKNFGARDLTAPILLLDSLRIVSDSSFRALLKATIVKVVEQGEEPVALLPIREVHATMPYYEPVSEAVSASEPEYLRPSSLPGSEALVANIIRDVVRDRQMVGRVVDRPSLEALREKKCRTLLLVDDYGGSGSRVVKFASALLRTPSIRSWRSYGLIRLHVALFAVAPLAEKAIHRSGRVDKLHVVEHGGDFQSAMWSDDERNAIRELCRLFAWDKHWALGYRRSEGLLALQHTVPNNLPAILWQRTRRNGRPWTPFFRERSMTSVQQMELNDYAPIHSPEEIAEGLRQFRLARRLGASPDSGTRTLLLVLGALGRGIRKPERLAIELGLRTMELKAALDAASQLGLVGPGNHLTDEGLKELRQARMQPRRVTLELDGKDVPYYPRQLRGSR
jgi:hypothetical protein